MLHRGPDAQGFVFSTSANYGGNGSLRTVDIHKDHRNLREYGGSRICLGHNRLKVIDLTDAGNQPLWSHEGRYVIIYNGEIYNYIELRKQLKSYGYRFLSNSDTEVIITAFQHWKEECFCKFNGMWALAILDTLSREVFLSRDRFGIKPLYVYTDDNGIFFASELKFFKALKLRLTLNPNAASNYINKCLIDYNEETFYDEIQSFPPAHYAVFSSDGKLLKKEKYWNIPIEEINEISLDEASERLCEIFHSSLDLRMRSDVPVGALLSGGLDSNSIISKLCKYFELPNDQIESFSAIFREKEFSEYSYINDTIHIYPQIKPHFVYPSPSDLRNDFESLLQVIETPFRSLSVYSQYCLYRYIKNNSDVIVLLNGQGADEIFAGYSAHFPMYLDELITHNRISIFLKELYYLNKYRNTELRKYLSSIILRLISRIKTRFSINDAIRDNNGKHEDILAYIPKNGLRKFRSLNEKLFHNLTIASLPEYLRYEDRNSMNFSLESRLPFLDYRIVEFVFRLGSCFKINRGVSKAILRNSVVNDVVPSVLNRKDKMGFISPQEIWHKTILKDWMRDIIQTDERSGILKQKQIEKNYSGYLDYEKNQSAFLWWRIFCFKYWYLTCFG